MHGALLREICNNDDDGDDHGDGDDDGDPG